jgi:hypothetical protein
VRNHETDQEMDPSGREDPDHDARTPREELAAQRQRLEQLKAQEEALQTLRERESRLEAEIIVADVEYTRVSPGTNPPLDLATAARIAETFDHKRHLQAQYEALEDRQALGGEEGARRLAQLRAGREALSSWLAAPEVVGRYRLSPKVRSAVVVAAIACILAAIAVHPIFLVMLLPLGLPLGYAAWSRQNLTWLRLGARRHLQATGLDAPADWNAADVRASLSEIDKSMARVVAEMEALRDPGQREADDRRLLALAAEITDAEARLEAALMEGGLGSRSIDREQARWLELAGAAARQRKELEDVRARREAVQAETRDGREALYLYLSRHGEAPPEGRADLDALAAGLDWLADRLARGDGPGGAPPGKEVPTPD